ncbi:hypothetical protein [Corynebacterium gerontici]|uniref:O-Antigen ligase n=1 Tax=Corynebacterium gerontici TaxID=2079234 RepID=A0A3G6IXE2_9CORY|nr:hypothetical protein [Corynebacterium gerontici]AZA10435.1 hypothetical protein CGERO_00485 [Corynebacterium gerontici]
MLTFYSVIAAFVAAPLSIWFAMVWFRRPAFAMGTGVALSVLSLTQFFPNSLRFALAASLVPHAVTALYASSRGTSPNRHLVFPGVAPVLIYVGMCGLSTIWSLNPRQTVISTIAWIVLLVFALSFRQLLSVHELRTIMFRILLVFFLVSCVTLATPFGWAGGRARGVFQNANAASIFVFLLAGLSIWMGKKYFRWLLPMCVVFTFLSGSRAGMLALIITLVVPFYGQMSVRQKALSAFGGLLALFPIGGAVMDFLSKNSSDAALLRTDNTREDAVIVAAQFIAEHPWLGAGYRGTPPGLGSSSFLKMFAEFGFGTIFAAIILVVAYIVWAKADSVMLALSLATIVDCLFEDWLLTAGAPMLLIFFTLLMSTPQKVREGVTPPAPEPKPASALRRRIAGTSTRVRA